MTATEQTAHGSEPDPDLVDVIRELSDRIEALKADVRRLDGPGLPASEPGWNDESDTFTPTPDFAWMSSVGVPVRRRPGCRACFSRFCFSLQSRRLWRSQSSTHS